MRLAVTTVFALALLAVPALAQERMPSPAGARVYFIAPADGATVARTPATTT